MPSKVLPLMVPPLSVRVPPASMPTPLLSNLELVIRSKRQLTLLALTPHCFGRRHCC